MEEFIKLIKRLRTDKGISTRELAEDIGVSQSYLSHLENGRRKAPPDPKAIKKLATALDYDFFDLMIKAGHITEDEYNLGFIDSDFSVHDEDIMRNIEANRKDPGELTFYLKYKNKIYYNHHLLGEQDRQRILDMLETLFPQYQNKKEGD